MRATGHVTGPKKDGFGRRYKYGDPKSAALDSTEHGYLARRYEMLAARRADEMLERGYRVTGTHFGTPRAAGRCARLRRAFSIYRLP